jgi:hypothetical protein
MNGLFELSLSFISAEGIPNPIRQKIAWAPGRSKHGIVEWMVFGRGVSGAGGRAYWVWWNGEGWVFICMELQCDEVKCTQGGGEKD